MDEHVSTDREREELQAEIEYRVMRLDEYMLRVVLAFIEELQRE